MFQPLDQPTRLKLLVLVVLGTELKMSLASVGSENGVHCLGVVENDIDTLQATVFGPSGAQYSNCEVTTISSGQIGN